MKRPLRFLRTTLVGGLLFLVPIVALALILGKAMVLADKIVYPLTRHLPIQSIIGLRTPMLLAAVLIVAFCFVAGFIARTRLAQRMVNRLEDSVLSSVPGYEFLKGMSASMLGAEDRAAYPVVFARFDDYWQIGFRIEALANGLVAVFVPNAPNPQSGVVYFMTTDRVVVADASLAATLKCMRRLGVGSAALLHGVSLNNVPAVETPGEI
jgi:uncharacterized membrane protein